LEFRGIKLSQMLWMDAILDSRGVKLSQILHIDAILKLRGMKLSKNNRIDAILCETKSVLPSLKPSVHSTIYTNQSIKNF